jgi:lysophospholipase L1-like esterase
MEFTREALKKLSVEQRVFRLRHIKGLNIVGMGDSSVFGVGDFGDDIGTNGAGWTGRLAHDLKAERYINLAKNGSRFRHVVKTQLNGAIAMKPDIALICVGTNDVLRGDFSPPEIESCVERISSQLTENGTVAVFLGIPDPMKTAPGPKSLKRILQKRVIIINWIIEEVAAKNGAIYLSLWDLPMSYDMTMWHIDHMHPSAKGHQEIADFVRRSMFLPRRSRTKLPTGRDTNKREEFIWLFTNGFKWFAKRSVDLVPALIWLIISNKFPRKHAY